MCFEMIDLKTSLPDNKKNEIVSKKIQLNFGSFLLIFLKMIDCRERIEKMRILSE